MKSRQRQFKNIALWHDILIVVHKIGGKLGKPKHNLGLGHGFKLRVWIEVCDLGFSSRILSRV
jgi:hypothetical protein